MKQMYARVGIALLYLMAFAWPSLMGIPLWASNISLANYFGTILVVNNGTAETYQSSNITNIKVASFIDGGYVASASNTTMAMRTTSGADVPFMPGYGASAWMTWVPSIGNAASLSYIFYTSTAGNITGSDLFYFPGAAGMTTLESPTLELAGNFTIEQAGYYDTNVTSARHNHYITGNDNDTALGGAWWYAQTFTPMQKITITSVKFLMYKVGGVGTITATLRETDASGHPVVVPPASELATGTTDGDTLTVNAAGEWREITFTNGYRLTAGARYAIVIKAPSAIGLAEVHFDDTVATFPGGGLEASNDSGATWNTLAGDDFMFEVWGTGSEGEKLLINKTNAISEYVSADGDISVDVWTPAGRWAEVASTINAQTHIFAVEEFNDKLYGSTSGGRLFEWNGTDAWVQVAPLLVGANNIRDLQEFNGKLYGADTSTGVCLEWNGTDAWVNVAAQLGGQTIYKLAVYDDGGGDDLYGCTDGNGLLFRWTSPAGPWVQVAAQLAGEAAVTSLAVYDDGGGEDLYGGTGAAGKLFQWNGVAAWVEVAPQLNGQTVIWDLEVYDDGTGDALYGSTANGGRLFQWNDVNAWVQVAPQFGAEATIFDLLSYNEHLYGCTGNLANLVYWNDTDAWVQAASRPDAETQVYQLVEFEDNLYGGTNPSAMLLQFMPDLVTVTATGIASGEHTVEVGLELR